MIKNFQFKHLRNSAEKDFKIVARNSKWYSFSHPGGRSNFLDKSLYDVTAQVRKGNMGAYLLERHNLGDKDSDAKAKDCPFWL